MPEAILIYAAGFGTRMGSLTSNRPKALIEVGGRPMLDGVIADARAARLSRIVVNAHYLADQITSHLTGQDVVVSHETPEILETGGGLKAALPLLGDGPVMTANSDAIFAGPNPMAELASAGLAEGAEANLLLVPLDRAVGRKGGGDFSLAPDGRLTRGGDYVYTGIQIIRTDHVLHWPEAVSYTHLTLPTNREV